MMNNLAITERYLLADILDPNSSSFPGITTMLGLEPPYTQGSSATQEEDPEVPFERPEKYAESRVVKSIYRSELPVNYAMKRQFCIYYMCDKFSEFFTKYRKLEHNFEYINGQLLGPTASYLWQLRTEDNKSISWNRHIFQIVSKKTLDQENTYNVMNLSTTYNSKYLNFAQEEVERYGGHAICMSYSEDLLYVLLGICGNLNGVHEYGAILDVEMEYLTMSLQQENTWTFKFDPSKMGRARLLEYQKKINRLTNRMADLENEIDFISKMKFIQDELLSGEALQRDMAEVKLIFVHIFKFLKECFSKIYDHKNLDNVPLNLFDANYEHYAFADEFKSSMEELTTFIRRHERWEEDQVIDQYVRDPCFYRYRLDHTDPTNEKIRTGTCIKPLACFTREFQVEMRMGRLKEKKCICNKPINEDENIEYREGMVCGIPVYGVFDYSHFRMVDIHKSAAIVARLHIVYWREIALNILHDFLEIMIKCGVFGIRDMEDIIKMSSIEFKNQIRRLADFGFMREVEFYHTRSKMFESKIIFHSIREYIILIEERVQRKLAARSRYDIPDNMFAKLKKYLDKDIEVKSHRVPTVAISTLMEDLDYYERRLEFKKKGGPRKRQKVEEEKKEKEEEEEELVPLEDLSCDEISTQ